MTRSNCWIEAIRHYRRLRRAGVECYFWVRASRLAPSWVPHAGVALHTGLSLEFWSFVPHNERKLRWYELHRALWFHGEWSLNSRLRGLPP